MTKLRHYRRFGRATWKAIPNGEKFKNGRRQWVSFEFVLDNCHKVYSGEITPRPGTMPIYPTRRFRNDPRGCTVAYG